MATSPLLDALLAQDGTLTLGTSFEQRFQLAVDEARSAFTHAKVDGLIRRAQLSYSNADLRYLDILEERGLNRDVIAQLATCLSSDRQHIVVLEDFTGSGKCYLGSAQAKQACTMRIRAHYTQMSGLEEAWNQAADKPQVLAVQEIRQLYTVSR